MKEEIWKIQHIIRVNEWLELCPGTPICIGWDKVHTKKEAYELYETFKNQPERLSETARKGCDSLIRENK